MGQIKNIKLHIVTDIKYSVHFARTTKAANDGQVKEPHSPQSNGESSSQWHQETSTQQVPLSEGSRPKVPQEPQVCQETQQVSKRTGKVCCWMLNTTTMVLLKYILILYV